ncbi:MAG: putative Ig domain-containing protein [Gemmataceae bacterium]
MTRTARTTLRVEPLEDRTTPAYTATLSGTTATFVGNSSGASGDIVVFGQSGGLLIHNRGLVDAGFASEFDFDSTVAGDQTLAADAASVVNLTTGGGPDTLQIGGQVSSGLPLTAARALAAQFHFTKSGAGDASVVIEDGLSTTGTTYTFASNGVTATGINVSFAGPAFGGGITLRTGTGSDTVNLISVLGIANGVEPRNVVNTGGSDTVTIGSAAGSLDGFAGQPVTVTGNGGTTAVVVNDAGDDDGDTYTVTAGAVRREDGANDTTVTTSGTGVSTSLNTGGGNDTVVMAAGATLNGGTLDAGAGVDTLDYSAFTSPVAVNLGLGTTGLTAALDGGQANPPQTSPSAGTAAISNYSVISKTFDLTLTVTDLDSATVTGIRLHRGGVGVNGTQLIDLLALGALVPVGTGFTLTLTGVPLAAADEAAFLGGQTYLTVGTAAANTLIRGQVFTNGNVNLVAGTATATGGVANIENVVGGSAADGLVGSFAANTLSGLGGTDVLVGGPGADTFVGGANDDVFVWSNGDGSDVMDGGPGNDTAAVNGNVTGNDVFAVGANGTRVDFDRTSAGPFSLDIGTVETLVVNGVGGADSFTVNALAGVADLTAVQLNGFAGADSFTVNGPPAGIATRVDGGAGADTLSVPTAGSATPNLTTATDANGVSGAFTFGDRGPVAFAAVEAVNPLVTSSAATTFTQAVAGTFTVTAAGAPAATFTVTAGVLPAGVTLSPAGVLSGTPTESGTFPLTITAATGVGPDATQAFTLTVEPNGDRFAVATGPGTPVRVKVFTPDGAELFTLAPFGAFAGGATVATADVTGDGVEDVVVGAGPGAGPHVKVFDGTTGDELQSFFAFAVGFTGGVFVGAGDVTGDGVADVVVGAGAGAGPHVKVFDGRTGGQARSFFAFAPDFTGGVSVRAGDVDGDGAADVVVGAGPGGAPHVKVFSGATGAELQSFFAGPPDDRSGVLVGVGNFDPASSRPEIVASVGGRVRVFGPPAGNVAALLPYIEQDNFVPFAVGIPAAPAAIRLGDGIIAILIGAVGRVAPRVQIIDGTSNTVRSSFFAFEEAFTGGVAVG